MRSPAPTVWHAPSSSYRGNFCRAAGTPHRPQDRLFPTHSPVTCVLSHKAIGVSLEHPPTAGLFPLKAREGCPVPSPVAVPLPAHCPVAEGGWETPGAGQAWVDPGRHPQDTGPTGGHPPSLACLGLGGSSCQLPRPQRATQGARANLQQPRQFPPCAGYFWKWLSDLFLSQAPEHKGLHVEPQHLLRRRFCKDGAARPKRLGLAECDPPGTEMCLKPERRQQCVMSGLPPDTELGLGRQWLAWRPGLAVEWGADREAAYAMGPACWALHPRPSAKSRCARGPPGQGCQALPLPILTPGRGFPHPWPQGEGPQNSPGRWRPAGHTGPQGTSTLC